MGAAGAGVGAVGVDSPPPEHDARIADVARHNSALVPRQKLSRDTGFLVRQLGGPIESNMLPLCRCRTSTATNPFSCEGLDPGRIHVTSTSHTSVLGHDSSSVEPSVSKTNAHLYRSANDRAPGGMTCGTLALSSSQVRTPLEHHRPRERMPAPANDGRARRPCTRPVAAQVTLAIASGAMPWPGSGEDEDDGVSGKT